MKTFRRINAKIIVAAFALFGIFTFSVFSQSSEMIVQMELNITENAEKIQRAQTSFEMQGNKISNPSKNLRIEGNKISFSSDLQGAEIRFSGNLTNGKLGGTLEVVEKGNRVATGTWNLARAENNPTDFSGFWKGAFSARPIPAQQADSSFDVSVARPAYTKKRPKVLFDEAHDNVHTASGLYKPFADLISNDGYLITPNKDEFTAGTLKDFDVLVIVNAAGPRGRRANPAFTEEECEAVSEWVKNGGALLFIADHAPMGSAAEILARRFGVEMSKGYTDDVSSKDKVLGDILFSRENRLLADSPITRGRNSSERISRVITFTGQSLKSGSDSQPLLVLPDTAVDTFPPTKQSVSAAGRVQGLTIKFGEGRVVVLGEAGMLTAQIDDKGRSFGMNYPNNDNKQFALNIMHWLSRLLN
jgi:hypothetical protein